MYYLLISQGKNYSFMKLKWKSLWNLVEILLEDYSCIALQQITKQQQKQNREIVAKTWKFTQLNLILTKLYDTTDRKQAIITVSTLYQSLLQKTTRRDVVSLKITLIVCRNCYHHLFRFFYQWCRTATLILNYIEWHGNKA